MPSIDNSIFSSYSLYNSVFLLFYSNLNEIKMKQLLFSHYPSLTGEHWTAA